MDFGIVALAEKFEGIFGKWVMYPVYLAVIVWVLAEAVFRLFKIVNHSSFLMESGNFADQLIGLAINLGVFTGLVLLIFLIFHRIISNRLEEGKKQIHELAKNSEIEMKKSYQHLIDERDRFNAEFYQKAKTILKRLGELGAPVSEAEDTLERLYGHLDRSDEETH